MQYKNRESDQQRSFEQLKDEMVKQEQKLNIEIQRLKDEFASLVNFHIFDY